MLRCYSPLFWELCGLELEVLTGTGTTALDCLPRYFVLADFSVGVVGLAFNILRLHGLSPHQVGIFSRWGLWLCSKTHKYSCDTLRPRAKFIQM